MTKKIWSHFQKSFTWYILIGVIVSLCSALAIYFFQQLLDHYQKSFQLGLLVAYGTTIILIPLLSYCEQKPKAYLTNGIYFYLKKLSLIKMSKISYEEYLKLGAGALLQKVEVGAAAGRNIHLNFYGRLFRELIPETLFNLFFIALIDKKLLPAILIGYVIVFILTKILLKTLQKMKEKTLISEEAMNATLIRGMTELVTFRINRKYKKEIENYALMAEENSQNITKMTMIHEFFFGFFALLVALIKVSIVVLSFTNVVTLSLGGLVAIVMYIDRIYTPIAIFNVLFVQYNLDKVAYQRLEDFYKKEDDPDLAVSGKALPEIQTISLKDVCFSVDSQTIMSQQNRQFSMNKTYGLIGKSGTGKSTLIKLILGLLKPTEGKVYVNQFPLTQFNLEDYYEKVFYLSQDVPIFQGTLKENIVLNQEISDEQVIEAMYRFQLGELYERLPESLNTIVSEKGMNFSGGEKQRIAFTRLAFTQAEILILDEATSALDEKTEEKVLQEVQKFTHNKLTILVTHRPKTLRFVDEIIDLNE